MLIMKMDISELLNQAEEGYQIFCRRKNDEIDLFAKSDCGDTLLHVAVGRQNLKEIRFLLNSGLDIDAQGDFLETPLYSAASAGMIAMVGILLRLGANSNIPDHRGDLPKDALFRAIQRFPIPYLEDFLDWSRSKHFDRQGEELKK